MLLGQRKKLAERVVVGLVAAYEVLTDSVGD